MPCEHVHGGVGQVEPPLQQAAARADAAEQERDRDDRQRIVARQERDQDPGVAVARRSARRWRVPWTAATSTMPASPAAPPPRKQVISDRAARRGSPASCAARTLPPTMRAAKPNTVCVHQHVSDEAGDHAEARGPSARRCPGRLPSMLASPMGEVDGLFRLAGSRSGPSTRWLNSAMRDVGRAAGC